MPEVRESQAEEAGNLPIILLDNNVLQRFLNKTTSPHLQDILEGVERVGATLAISEIVLYEALKAIVFNEEKSDEVYSFVNKYLTRYIVDVDLLTQAARVHEIYGCDPETRQQRNGISTEDILIGTTAMVLGAYVLTCDCNDFPVPFFKENNRQIIYYNEGNKRRHIIMYLLEPDNEVISAALEQLKPPPKPPKKKTPTKKTKEDATKPVAKKGESKGNNS